MMMTLCGRIISEPDPAAEMLCVATLIQLRDYRYLPPFLRLNDRIFKQLDKTPGLLRWAILVEPWRMTFYTFTAWRDRPSLLAFTDAEPHAGAVRRMRTLGGPQRGNYALKDTKRLRDFADGALCCVGRTASAEWTTKELPGRLSEIKERLKTPTSYYQEGGSGGSLAEC